MNEQAERRNRGLEAEYLFQDILQENNIPFEYVNDWYDFKVLGACVDVKSARISHKCTSKRNNQSYAIGRFHFTEEQKENKVWIAFFIRWDEKYIFVGMMKLGAHVPSYFSIHQLREHNIMNLNEFKQEVEKNK